MAEPKKSKRRQSQIFSDLSLKDKLQDEELINYYQNKNYVAPTQKKYETLFEGPKRGFSEDGKVVLGKNASKRYIEDYEFWKQNNKEKISRRKMMIQKQFKGRKKTKRKQLTTKQEQQLQSLVENVPEEGEEPLYKDRSSIGNVLMKVTRFMSQHSDLPRSNRPQTLINDIDPESCGSIGNSEGDTDSNTAVEIERGVLQHTQQIVTSEEAFDVEIDPKGKGSDLDKCSDVINARIVDNDELGIDIDKPELEGTSGGHSSVSVPSLSRIEDVCKSPEFPLEGFEDVQDERLRKELLSALYSEDLMFCEPTQQQKKERKEKKDSRVSVRRSVRRSARFLKDNPSQSGSVFAFRDFAVNPAKVNQDNTSCIHPEAYSSDLDNKLSKETRDRISVCEDGQNEPLVSSQDLIPTTKEANKEEIICNAENPDKSCKDPLRNLNFAKTYLPKRNYLAKIETESSGGKENVAESKVDSIDFPNIPSKKKRRRPGLIYENNVESTKFVSRPDKVRKSSLGPSDSSSIGRKSTDISIPEFVLRSSTGEYSSQRLSLPGSDIKSNEQEGSCKRLGSPEKEFDEGGRDQDAPDRKNSVMVVAEEKMESSSLVSTKEKANSSCGAPLKANCDSEKRYSFFNDSDDEILIAGIFGKKTLQPKRSKSVK